MIDKALKNKINEIKSGEVAEIKSNEDSDFGSIILFLIISTCSEILIIAGIYFRELYEHKSFYENENKLDPILKKREKYDYLLKIVYKNGDVKPDEVVISLKRLSDIIHNKGAQYSTKLVNDFYSEMTHLMVFKIIGNKRYALVSYNEAIRLLETI